MKSGSSSFRIPEASLWMSSSKHRLMKSSLFKILLVLESPLSHKNGLVLFDQIIRRGGDPLLLTAQHVYHAVAFGPGREKLFFDRALELDDQVILANDLVIAGCFQKMPVRIEHTFDLKRTPIYKKK